MALMIPLFEHFPALSKQLPYAQLADLPTPVERLSKLGEEIGIDQLWVKRDDLTGKAYGGNKIRKLELLLGDALRSQAREVMTFGFAGSNHASATSVYAKELGLRSISMLMPQPNAEYVRQNLLLSFASCAELHHYDDSEALDAGVEDQLRRHARKTGREPAVIPPGGSVPLGVTGFVNAAMELKAQIDEGVLPEPDCIYATLGSTGTVVGLLIGLRAVGLGTRIKAVRVVDTDFIPVTRTAELFNETVEFLSSLDSRFPQVQLAEEDIEVEDGFLGEGYALFTPEGIAAIREMRQTEGFHLDGTYTGKTLAALLAHAKAGELENRSVLFWNTLSSRDVSEIIADIDYRQLPPEFHRYFEEEVQSLER
jgi:D-cysteine desulfhydrase